ncbi:MAG: zinc-binding dehydrogenase, partial [Acidobacteriota bacterium]
EPMQLAGCGACPPCRRGDYHLCGGRDHDPQRRRSAGFSELDVADVGNVFPLPEQVSLAAASLADVYACAVHAIHRVPIEMSSTVAILGTGPIGMALGQVARAVGARRTILVGRRPEPLDQALAAGAANHTVDASREESLAAAVRALTDGEGAAVVFEAVGGSGDTLRQAVAMARPGAVVGILGAFVGDVAVAYREANAKELDLRWSNGYSTWRGAREFQIALGLIAEGRVEAAPLITHRYPLERIAEAFAAADDKRSSGAIKVVVEPS